MPSETSPARHVLSWPSLAWEQRPWVSRISPDLLSRATRDRLTQPYSAAVVPAIATLPLTLPADVATLDAEATAQIARFDAEMGSQLAPFAAVLLRSESASSSRIENLTSSAKAIALAELGATSKRNAAAIVANVAAMTAAIQLADRLDEPAILAMHRALMADEEPASAGTWRTEQAWLGGDAVSPHTAAFVPPHHDRVPALMADLASFVARKDLPVLSQAAIAHAQFETIHPFTDGNGRTGRALIHAMFRGHRLTRHVSVPVSAGLLTDTTGYIDTLTAYRSGDPLAVIAVMAQASMRAIANGRELVGDLRAIRQGWGRSGTLRTSEGLAEVKVEFGAQAVSHMGLRPAPESVRGNLLREISQKSLRDKQCRDAGDETARQHHSGVGPPGSCRAPARLRTCTGSVETPTWEQTCWRIR